MDKIDIRLIILVGVLLFLIIVQTLIIIFRERLANFFKRKAHLKNTKKLKVDLKYFISNLASALAKMSFDKTGAVIVMENENNMQKYIDAGKKVDVDFFPEFVTSVFYNHKSPLHDGAMIIRNLKIVSLSSYLPMTKKTLPVYYGARHRAGIGICEHYDCFSFVVSETTGAITFVHNDEIKQLSSSPEELVESITKILWTKSIYKKSFSK